MKSLKLVVLALLFACLIALPQFLFAENVVEDTCISEPTDMSVNYGDYIFCSIAPVGDSDTYRIWGNEGDRMSIDVLGLEVGPCLLIADPNGDIIHSGCNNATGAQTFNQILTETGKYTITISLHNHFDVG